MTENLAGVTESVSGPMGPLFSHKSEPTKTTPPQTTRKIGHIFLGCPFCETVATFWAFILGAQLGAHLGYSCGYHSGCLSVTRVFVSVTTVSWFGHISPVVRSHQPRGSVTSASWFGHTSPRCELVARLVGSHAGQVQDVCAHLIQSGLLERARRR